MSDKGVSGDGTVAGRGRGRGLLKPRSPKQETREKLAQPPTGLSESVCGAKQSDNIETQNNSKKDVLNSSQLSAAASPFSPKSSSNITSKLQVDAPQFIPKITQGHNPNAAEFIPKKISDPSQADLYERVQNVEIVLEQVQDTLDDLSANPGRLNSSAQSLSTTLNNCISDENVLLGVIDIIFERAVADANVRYTVARLCNIFTKKLTVPCPTGSFKQHLFRRCHLEFEKKEEYLNDLSKYQRVHGFTMFMGELFLNLTVQLNDGRTERAVILRTALLKLLNTLLQKPNDDNLKCAGQLLKFCGSALEDEETNNPSKSGSIKLEDILKLLKDAMLLDGISKNIKHLIMSVVELRASNWGRLESSPVIGHESPGLESPSSFTGTQTEPIFYDSSGQVISRTDAGFYQEEPSYTDVPESPSAYYPYYDQTNVSDADYGMWSSGEQAGYGDASSADFNEFDEIEQEYENFLRETEQKGT